MSQCNGPILLFDACTKRVQVGLFQDNEIVAEYSVSSRKTSSELFIPTAQRLLEDVELTVQDVGAVAVNAGPGFFTGLRIALSTAVTLASNLDVPLVCLDTLEVLALNVREARRPTLVVLDGKKRQLFWGSYEWRCEENDSPRLVLREGPASSFPEVLVEKLTEKENFSGLVLGEGLEKYGEVLQKLLPKTTFMEPPLWYPRLAWMGHLANEQLLAGKTTNPMEAKPFYLRASDAELGNPSGMP